jgi:cytochrome c556
MKKSMIIPLILATAIGGAAVAGGHAGNPAVKARQAHMGLYNFHAGYLGGVMRGRVDYDAGTAQGAANALVALANIDQSRMWPPGSDADSIEGTRAKAEIWADFPGVMKQLNALKETTAALAAVAGDGEDAMKAALGPVFGVCGACHEAYRVPQ